MTRISSTRPGTRRGAVAAQAAISLAVLLGIAAITVDGGLMQAERRRAQANADAAALAAAADLFKRYNTNNGLDPSPYLARDSALAVATANGYTSSNSVITPNAVDGSGKPVHGIWIPPITGDHIGQAGYVEVAVQYNQKRYFSSVFGSGDIPIRARAVARGRMGPPDVSILVLNSTANAALSVAGNATITVSGKIIVDSNASTALETKGTSHLIASDVEVVGGVTSNNNSSVNAPTSGSTTGVLSHNNNYFTPDPLASLSPPSTSGLVERGTNNPSRQYEPAANETMQPGIYTGGINVKNPGVKMASGIYYLKKGEFSTASAGSVTSLAGGVLIYLTKDSSSPTYSTLTISGGQATLSPLTTGTLAGIIVFQDRDAPVDVNKNLLTIAPDTGSVRGMIYAAKAKLSLKGNNQTFVGDSFIVDRLDMNGTTDFTLPDPLVPVRASRAFGLVE